MPYGGTTPEEDKKIEACVAELLSDPDFKGYGDKTREETAIAICKKNVMKKNIFIEFTKTDAERREVHGYATTEALDAHDEVVELSAIIKALPQYNQYNNIREMHSNSAVGRAIETIVDGKGLFIIAKIVDDVAWKKVKEKVYNGFSIGGRIISMVENRITELTLDEISLVDRPANPEAVFSLFKREDNNTINMSEEKKDLTKQEENVVEASEEHKAQVAEDNAKYEAEVAEKVPTHVVEEDGTPVEEEVEEKEEEVIVEDKKEEKPKKKKFVESSMQKAEMTSFVKELVKDSLQEVQDKVSRLEKRLSKYEEGESENKAHASYVVKKEDAGGEEPTADSLKENIAKKVSMLSPQEIDLLDDKTRNIIYNSLNN